MSYLCLLEHSGLTKYKIRKSWLAQTRIAISTTSSAPVARRNFMPVARIVNLASGAVIAESWAGEKRDGD